MACDPDAILRLLDELEANRRSRKNAWATLQRLRKFLEANGARISIPDDRNFETEGEAIESGLRRTVEGHCTRGCYEVCRRAPVLYIRIIAYREVPCREADVALRPWVSDFDFENQNPQTGQLRCCISAIR